MNRFFEVEIVEMDERLSSVSRNSMGEYKSKKEAKDSIKNLEQQLLSGDLDKFISSKINFVYLDATAWEDDGEELLPDLNGEWIRSVDFTRKSEGHSWTRLQ